MVVERLMIPLPYKVTYYDVTTLRRRSRSFKRKKAALRFAEQERWHSDITITNLETGEQVVYTAHAD